MLSGTTVPVRIVSQSRSKSDSHSGGHFSGVVPSWREHIAFSEGNDDDDEGEIASQDPGEEEKRDERGRGKAYHEAVASDQFGRRAEPART